MAKTSQDTKTTPNAMALLSRALEELNHQVIPDDIQAIAKRAKVSERTVRRYVKEKGLTKFNTGKKILGIGREIVIKREQSLSC